MKTHEAIKKLMDDPTMKFKDECGRVIGLHNGLISFFDKDLNFMEIAYFGYVEHDWQPVQQSVTWQEAIAAWIVGKKVVWEEDTDRRVFDRGNRWRSPKNQTHMIDQDGDAVTARMFSEGKWHVEG